MNRLPHGSFLPTNQYVRFGCQVIFRTGWRGIGGLQAVETDSLGQEQTRGFAAF
jgi:hypothetical protein